MKTRFENKLELSGLLDKLELKSKDPSSRPAQNPNTHIQSIFGLKSSSLSKSLVAKDRSGIAVY